MNAFLKFLGNYVSVSEAEWNVIQNAFAIKEFSRNEIILNQGDICRHFYFIEKGMVRFFVMNDGNDVTKFFTKSPNCFTSKDSFRNRKVSVESIQAIDDVVVWQTSLEKANELLKLKSWSEFTRKFMHEVQSHVEDLLMESKTKTAEERYQKLLQNYPDEIHKIPLMYLASFLGITPQSLSRIRKKHK